MTTEITDSLIQVLGRITTRNEAGRHFTETHDEADIDALEAAGLLKVNRPVHEATGISYSQDYWSVEITEDGQELVDANPDLFD